MSGTRLALFADENANARRQCDNVKQEDGWTQIQAEP
jgi:hypothetical protein